MANNYQQFCFALPLKSDTEKRWVRRVLLKQSLWIDEEYEGRIACEFDKKSVIFFADESGNPEAIAFLIQRFLRRFHPEKSFFFEWADTCSSLKIYQFGGGCCAITKDSVIWRPTYVVASEICAELGLERL